jgi:hypothetical protein
LPKILKQNLETVHRIFLCIVLLVVFTQCHSSKRQNESMEKDLSKIKIGMTFVDVIRIAGAPDTIIHRGIVEDTFHNQTKTDEWQYGSNELVVIVNDTVNAIDLNADETQRRINHIMDSAKAAEGNEHPIVQPIQ